jgi:hypothetical protein
MPYEHQSVFDDERGNWDYRAADVIKKRGAFWEWWLTEAMAEAWLRAQ